MRQTAKFRTTILGNDKVNDKSYRSTVAVMGGKFMVGVSAENRRIVGVAEYAAANKFFDGLSYSKKQWFVLGIQGAKTAETRERRIVKAIGMLKEGRDR